LEDHI